MTGTLAPAARSPVGALSLEEAVVRVIAENPVFTTGTAEIRGIEYTVFTNVPNNLRELLEAGRPAQDNGAAEYLVFEGERWSYDSFCAEIYRLAQALEAEHGITKGSRVALALQNCPELLMAMMAITALGGVVTFLNAWWTTEELDYALRDSGARVVFADAERLRRLAPLAEPLDLSLVGVRDGEGIANQSISGLLAFTTSAEPPDIRIDPDDDMAIMYSSGTTGHPKGVVQTHRGAINAVYTWLMQAAIAPLMDPPTDADAPKPRPCALIVTPLFHVTATHPMFLLSLPAGAKIVLMSKWDAKKAVTLIRDEAVTRFLGVPTQSEDLRRAAREMGETLPTLDFLGSGGAKRPAPQVAELAEAFPNAKVATGWGMTETNANGIGLIGPDYLSKPGAAGRLYPPVQELRFLDDDGVEVPPGEVGEITVKSPCNMRVYLNKPEATAEVLQEGWLRTGDLGYIDEDGVVFIVDRKKNIVIRGGENIACLDVEGALHRHPAVAEACAFSLPHPRLGEVVGASVQLRPGATTDEAALQAFLRDHIAHFKIPERIWIGFDPLPRGATDKIDRRALRAHCLKDWKEPTDV